MTTARTILLAGPTASGKTALAITLARRHDGVIINADSMQIYADAPILTARPTPAEMSEAPHRLYGVVPAGGDWSVQTWRDAAAREIAAVHAEGRTAIIVGGTGLYFRALTHGLVEMPPIPEALRDALRAEPDLSEIRRQLATLDPDAFARLGPNDRARNTRALEVVLATGRPLLHWQQTGLSHAVVRPEAARRLVLAPDRADLHARINRRFAAMIAAGALDEVRGLVGLGLPPTVGVMKAIGLRPLRDHLDGAMSLAQAIEVATAETRQYAKRQETWFRNQMADWQRIAPVATGDGGAAQASETDA